MGGGYDWNAGFDFQKTTHVLKLRTHSARMQQKKEDQKQEILCRNSDPMLTYYVIFVQLSWPLLSCLLIWEIKIMFIRFELWNI